MITRSEQNKFKHERKETHRLYTNAAFEKKRSQKSNFPQQHIKTAAAVFAPAGRIID